MPELPEVEIIARRLDKVLKGKVIKTTDVFRERSFKGVSKMLAGKKVKKVWRRSKILTMEFFDWNKLLLVHLKMTGQLVLIGEGRRVVGGHPTADWLGELPNKHTRVVIKFNNGSELFFNDLRGFGWMKIGEIPDLPPDVIDKEFTLQLFKEIILSSGRKIKQVIMDQKKFGGLGNIYANDGLFLAGVDPKKPANNLNENEIRKLWKAIRKVVNRGIILDGKYREHFLVYDREGVKCKKCGGKIKKFKLGGRGTYWCSRCQK